MKNLKMLLLAVILLLGNSCDDGCIELLTIVIEDDTLTNGEILELDIAATDCDGIASIAIEISVLQVDLLIENLSSSNDMEVEKEWVIDDANYMGTFEVKVTVKDGEGNEEIDVSDFTIN